MAAAASHDAWSEILRLAVRFEIPALLGFGCLALLATWPMVLHLSDGLFRGPGDPQFYAWVIPWNVRAVLHHPLSVFQANIYFPEPNTLAYADHMLGLVPLALPFWPFTRDGTTLNNLVTIVSFALNGWSAYLLAREVVGARVPSVVAGVIYLLAPYHNVHIGHANLLASYPIPLTILAAVRLVKRPGPWRAAAFAGAWLLAALSSWYYLTYVAVALLFVVPPYLWAYRRSFLRAAVWLAAGAAAVAVLSYPFLKPFLEVTREYPQANRNLFEAEHYTPLPSAIAAPPNTSRLLADATVEIRERQGSFFHEKVLYPGFLALALAGAGILAGLARRKPHLWLGPLGAAAASYLIALGPYQMIRGARRQMPFYYLHQYVPAFSFMRAMARSDVVLVLMVGILAALALSALPRRNPARIVIAASVTLLVAAELSAVPVPWTEAPKPGAGYVWLASAPQGAVLELPTATLDADGRVDGASNVHESVYMYFSTVHWHPLVNGYSGFVPPSYRTMLAAARALPSKPAADAIRVIPVRYIVVHRDLVPGTTWGPLGAGPAIPGYSIAYEDEELLIYETVSPA